jgi:hypothetical protein
MRRTSKWPDAAVVEPAEAADLGDDHRSDDQRYAAQRLDRLHHRSERPLRHQLEDRSLQPVAQRLGPLDPLQHLFVRQMLSWVRKNQFAQPAPMHLGPMS